MKNNRIIYATNNLNGYKVLAELLNMGIDIEYLLVHPSNEASYLNEILELANLPENHVFTWHPSDKIYAEKIKNVAVNENINTLFSVNFGYIFPFDFINTFENAFNLHISYLPYNKGANPNVWAIIDNTPAGVTIHQLNEGIDDGKIYAKKQVHVDPCDNGKTLYDKLSKASVEIVNETFIDIISGNITPFCEDGGSFHLKKEFTDLCKIDLDKKYSAKELIDFLRALTYPPHKNAYFEIDGKKYYVNIEITSDVN
ncbi:MAG: hypothetical protein KAW93_04315 [Methanogenium sp.]|nr:hypothetical protein [Methanogenium sp.]